MGVIIAALSAVFHIIIKLLGFLAKLVYRIIRFFGLQFPALYLLVMLVIELCTHAVSATPQRISLFWLGLCLSVLIAAVSVIRRIFFPKRKRDEEYYRRKFEKEREREEKKILRPEPPQPTPIASPAPEPQTAELPDSAQETVSIPKESLPPEQIMPETPPQARRERRVRYPQIYRVRQDERFLVYEYEDRNELYFEDSSGLRLVRTDKK